MNEIKINNIDNGDRNHMANRRKCLVNLVNLVNLGGLGALTGIQSLLLVGCATGSSPSSPKPVSQGVPVRPMIPLQPGQGRRSKLSASEGLLLAQKGRNLLGTPYKFGGDSPVQGFDCSGFIHYLYRTAADIKTPRTARELQLWAPPIPSGQERIGDLVFFGFTSYAATHAGIYVGAGRFVHAPSSGGVVREEALMSSYWRRGFLGFGRP